MFGSSPQPRAPWRPPPYVELLSFFVSLESPAEACGNGDASFYLQKARMSFIKAHAFKPVQQADTMGNGVIV